MFLKPAYWAIVLAGALVYWCLPARLRLWALLAISLAVLAPSGPYTLLAMGALALAVYRFSLSPATAGRKWWGRALILGCLGLLLAIKHLPALRLGAWESGLLPAEGALGGSYFAFKMIHVIVESSRGGPLCDSLPLFLVYSFLLPIFAAGPIQRLDLFVQGQKDRLTLDDAVGGARRIMFGLIKKVLVAHLLYRGAIIAVGHHSFVPYVLSRPATGIWYYALVRLGRVYADFSGYSDLAIGTGAMFGFTIQENFNYPVLASDITVFWRRWHMTLVGWCRSYIYLPLIALTRRPYLSICVTFSVIGLWHSLTLPWLLWGLYHAAGVCLFVTLRRIGRRLGWSWTDRLPVRLAGTVLTLLYVAAGGILTWPDMELSPSSLAHLLGKLLFMGGP